MESLIALVCKRILTQVSGVGSDATLTGSCSMARAALLLAAALGAACLPETGAWIDVNVLWRRWSDIGSHGTQHRCRGSRATQVKWGPRRNLERFGSAVRGIPPLLAKASGGVSNATVDWMTDVQLTRAAQVSTNSSSSGRPSTSSRLKSIQGSKPGGLQPSNDGNRGPRREGDAERPVEEGPGAKEGVVAGERREQEAARDRSDENDVNKPTLAGGIAADSSEVNGRKRKRKGKAEARLQPRNPGSSPSLPPAAGEPQAAAEEEQERGEGEEGGGLQGSTDEAQRGTSPPPPPPPEPPRKPAPRGFGKPKPKPAPSGKSRSKGRMTPVQAILTEKLGADFEKLKKFLELLPEDYAKAREVLVDIFGNEDAGPWIADIEQTIVERGFAHIIPAPAPTPTPTPTPALPPPVAAAPAPPPPPVSTTPSSTPMSSGGTERKKQRAERKGGAQSEEVTLPIEQLGLKRRGGREGEGKGKQAEEEEEEAEEVDEEEDAKLAAAAEGGQGGGGEGGEEGVLKDKRAVATHIKDAKLNEYIKDKKNARTTRDKFLADMGIVRSEVHPPQRFIEVYYNTWADDFYTAITTSSNRFGSRWWFREALSHSASDVMIWLRQWYRMAKKHRVLHDDVAAMLSEALREGDDDEGPILSETQRYDALKDRIRRWREPRIIAIGDVHGCIDELRALLKKVEYSPGDLVIFLGDIVAKGPESVNVVRLAREIGALSVRGNHENEVIRWSRAMALGAQSNFKSEHYLIALGLSEEDLEWLRSLPWYISCSDLQLLFVHAGFVSNLRLSKQHPRFMINMRSILADGTVSARFYQDYPWARTWEGPQTVLFGHDARRGMQAYDQALGLDTGCVYGGNLTACLIPAKTIVQVPAAEPYIVNRYERIIRRAEHLKDRRKGASQGE